MFCFILSHLFIFVFCFLFFYNLSEHQLLSERNLHRTYNCRPTSPLACLGRCTNPYLAGQSRSDHLNYSVLQLSISDKENSLGYKKKNGIPFLHKSYEFTTRFYKPTACICKPCFFLFLDLDNTLNDLCQLYLIRLVRFYVLKKKIYYTFDTS